MDDNIKVDLRVLELINEAIRKTGIRSKLSYTHRKINKIYKEMRVLGLIKNFWFNDVDNDWYPRVYKITILTEKWEKLLKT